MELTFLLVLVLVLSVLTAAQTPTQTCACPQVKCSATDPVGLCTCLNNRETLCKISCPDYIPTYLSCPTKPTATPTPSPQPCVCEPGFCIQMWPQSCYCSNAQKARCAAKCGGEADLMSCPPLSTPSMLIRPPHLPATDEPISPPQSLASPTGEATSATRLPPPKLPLINVPCHSSPECDTGFKCASDPYKVKDPSQDTCGTDCVEHGICVAEKPCGGFAGFSCDISGQVCEYYAASKYVADDFGVCVWPGKGDY